MMQPKEIKSFQQKSLTSELQSINFDSFKTYEIIEMMNSEIEAERLPKHSFGENLTLLEVLMLQGNWKNINKFFVMVRSDHFKVPKFPRESVRKGCIKSAAYFISNDSPINGMTHIFTLNDIQEISDNVTDGNMLECMIEEVKNWIEYGNIPEPNEEITADFLSNLGTVDIDTFEDWLSFCASQGSEHFSVGQLFANAIAQAMNEDISEVKIFNNYDELPTFIKAEVLIEKPAGKQYYAVAVGNGKCYVFEEGFDRSFVIDDGLLTHFSESALIADVSHLPSNLMSFNF